MSPTIGARGARTRQTIVEAALQLFEEQGFHNTSVDEIAGSVGLSRAALYQYFANKNEIFIELLHESGSAMLRVVRRLGPVGPSPDGYSNLHWWLGEWAWVYDKYSTIYVQWANVETPETSLKPLISQFLDAYTRRLGERIRAADPEGLEPEAAATILFALINRTNYYRHTIAARGLSDDDLVDALATIIQLTLFPSTPAAVLHTADLERSDEGDSFGRPPSRAGRSARVRVVAAPSPQSLDQRFAASSAKVRVTVRSLLDGGSRVFARLGFHLATVDDIVSEAGFARGTFYKYFADKQDLLITLAEECGEILPAMMSDFKAAVSPGSSDTGLRDWLTSYIRFHRRYAGVFRVLLDQVSAASEVAALGERIAEVVLDAFDEVLGGVRRDYPLSVRAASLLLLALLERIPDQLFGTGMEDEELADLLTTVITRGFLASSTPRRKTVVLGGQRAVRRSRASSG